MTLSASGTPRDAHERTKQVYEEIAGCPKPPAVPLPEPGDLASLERFGLKLTPVSTQIVRAAMFATGFRSFQEQLPGTVDNLLRECNLRGANLFTPVISATLALEDDPRVLSPIERGVTLLFAARSLHRDISCGNILPDRHGDQVLEMGQYPNLFSTSLVLDGKAPRIYKSASVSQITVAVARRLYLLRIEDLRPETEFEQMKEAVTGIVLEAQRRRLRDSGPPAGLLTAATHETQCKVFHQIGKIKANSDSLSAIRHSLVTLCLDLESNPSSYAEAARMAHSGNCGNRWYHSSFQLVVFGNARACAICNFSTYLDGNTMMRAASEIQRRAEQCQKGNGVGRNFVSLPPARELKWEISQQHVRRAQEDLRLVQDNQQATFEIKGIGRKFFTDHNVEPVPAFMLALAMAGKRLTGKVVKITQFLTMAKYSCMDLATALVTTPEVVRFVDYVESGDVQYGRASALLREATSSQLSECREARRHLPLDSILDLFISSRKGVWRLYAGVVLILALMLLRLMGLFRPSDREVIASHPEIYHEIPIVGRPGVRLPYVKYFGIHYQMLEDRIVVTLMPSVSWTVPNAELIAELTASLKRVQSIILETSGNDALDEVCYSLDERGGDK